MKTGIKTSTTKQQATNYSFFKC